MSAAAIAAALAGEPRVRLATLPTPLEAGPPLPGGAQLLVKRDDLTGLGMGGNKARKLELLCGAARERGADVLVTVGAEQSNHARMSAAAGAVLGLDTHLVLGGDPEAPATGNRLLAELFGATVHQPGSDDWAVLSAELERVTARLRDEGRRPYAFPLGGSTATGALGFMLAWAELMEQCDSLGVRPSAIVHASSTGGTHGGLLAGRAADAATGAPVPDVVAIGVAKEPGRDLAADARRLAEECLDQPPGCLAPGSTRRSSSTSAGSGLATQCPARRATTRSCGPPGTAAGYSTARTPARRSAACSAAPARAATAPGTRSSSGIPAGIRPCSRPTARRSENARVRVVGCWKTLADKDGPTVSSGEQHGRGGAGAVSEFAPLLRDARIAKNRSRSRRS